MHASGRLPGFFHCSHNLYVLERFLITKCYELILTKLTKCPHRKARKVNFNSYFQNSPINLLLGSSENKNSKVLKGYMLLLLRKENKIKSEFQVTYDQQYDKVQLACHVTQSSRITYC